MAQIHQLIKSEWYGYAVNAKLLFFVKLVRNRFHQYSQCFDFCKGHSGL